MITPLARFLSRFDIKTQGRIILAVGFIPSVTIPTAVASYFESRVLHASMEARARVLTETLAARAQKPLLEYDVVELDDLLESLRSSPESYEDVSYAIVLDAEGRVMAHSRAYAEYGRIPDDPVARVARTSPDPVTVQWFDSDGLLEVSKPITVQGKRWGTVRVGVSLAALHASLFRDSIRIFAVACVLGVLLGFLISRLFRPLFLAPVYRLVSAVDALGRRDFGHRIEHWRRDEIGGLYDAVNRTAEVLAERERLYDTFGRYVTTQVRDAILAGQVGTEGRQVRAAVLFADLRGFTTRSEGQPPEEILALLNAYCGRMTTAIHAHGGIVDKFMGDAVMALFGVPVDDPDCARQAVRAVEAMRAQLEELNTELAAEGREPLRMGVGVHLGGCVAGSVGPPTRQQYTVVGDTVNLASRLQALTKRFGVDVLVSEEVVKACGEDLVVRDLGAATVDGREQPVHAYQLLGTKYDRRSSDDLLERERQRERGSAG